MAPLAMVMSPDQSMRASRQTAATAVTTGRIDAWGHWPHGRGQRRDRIRRTDTHTRTRTIRRAMDRIKLGLAEMGVAAITDAHHQPNRWCSLSTCPGQAHTGRAHNGRVCCNINAMHACTGIKRTEVGDRGQILITGSTNQLDPGPSLQGALPTARRRHQRNEDLGPQKTSHRLPTKTAGAAHFHHHLQARFTAAEFAQRQELGARQNLTLKEPKHNRFIAQQALPKQGHHFLHFTNSSTASHALMTKVWRPNAVLLKEEHFNIAETTGRGHQCVVPGSAKPTQ